MPPNPHTTISKTISYALRHKPEEFGLELEDNGWTTIDHLLEALIFHDASFASVTLETIQEINNLSSKKRFEIVGHKIRAAYGHSFSQHIAYPKATPPATLYHGTTVEAYPRIVFNGLQPMSRQYVHMTEDKDLALLTAKRRSKKVVLLKIDTLKARESGVIFYNPGPRVWLCKGVDWEFMYW